MDVGIKEAKNNLSGLVAQASAGERIFLTNRGERVAELVPVKPMTPDLSNRGFGWLKGTAELPKNYSKFKREYRKEILKNMGLL